MKKTGQTFECINEKGKKIIKKNNLKIKEMMEKINFMFEHKTDPACLHRKELNKEIKRLRVENAKIRKGILILKDDPIAGVNQ